MHKVIYSLNSIIAAELTFIKASFIKFQTVLRKSVTESFVSLLSLRIGFRAGDIIEHFITMLIYKMLHQSFHYGIIINTYIVELLIVIALENNCRNVCSFNLINDRIPYIHV